MLRSAGIGFTTGSMVSCGGVGASVVLIPALTNMGLSQLSANATSMAVLVGSSVTTAATFSSAGQCDLLSAAAIAGPSMAIDAVSAGTLLMLSAHAAARTFARH